MEWMSLMLVGWVLVGMALAFGVGLAMGSHRSSAILDAAWDRTTREDAQPWCGRSRE